jgi:lipid A 3-O-deacylase
MEMRRYGFIAAVGIVYVLSIPCAWAQGSSETTLSSGLIYGIRLGVSAHDVGGLWSHLRAEGSVDVNAEIVFRKPGFNLWHGLVQPNLGVTINTQGQTSRAYGGLLGEFLFDTGFFVDSGVGLEVHNGQLESDDANKKQLGSRVLFRIPIELGFTMFERHRLPIIFDHMSNAYLVTPNEGMDTIGVRFGFQF